MIFTRHTDLRNKTPLFAEVARRTACPRAAEGARVRARAQNMLNDLKRIGNSYQVPQGQRLRVVSSESQSDNTIMPLCPPHPIIWLIKIGMNEGDGCPQSARLPTARCPYFQENNITPTCGIR